MFITYIFVVVCMIVCGIYLFKCSLSYHGDLSVVPFIFCVFCFANAAGICAYTAFTAREYYASEHRTNIINKACGTTYSKEEVFYASNAILIINSNCSIFNKGK